MTFRLHKNYGIRRDTLFDKYLNKPQNYKEYTFRTLGHPYWNPPKTYMRNKQLDNARVNYFLKVENTKDNTITYHHSIIDVAISLFSDKDKETTTRAIMKKVNNGANPTILKDYTFRKLDTCGELVHSDGTIVQLE